MGRSKRTGRSSRRLNAHFNRYESSYDGRHEHEYLTALGGDAVEEHITPGWIKCKLVHAAGGSLIVPDQIYFRSPGAKPRTNSIQWLQPLAFMAPQLMKRDSEIWCELCLDIPGRQTIRVTFYDREFERTLDDGSYLFRCTIRGPRALATYSTGSGTLGPDGVPRLELYHHTTEVARESILATREFWSSRWNIQGVAKKLRNVGYVYLTPLEALQTNEDLTQVAMASSGYLFLLRDNAASVPGIPTEQSAREEAERRPQDILMLPVARSSTTDRRSAIRVTVDADLLAPQHLLAHDLSTSMTIYYEVNQPFIQRVGLVPGSNLPLDRAGAGVAVPRSRVPLKRHDYIVVGDATTIDGLAAPYDEEDTSFVLKIHRVPEGLTPLSFWFARPNEDHYSPLSPERMEFEEVRPQSNAARADTAPSSRDGG